MIQQLCKLAVVLSALIPTAVYAGYVNNYSDWKRATQPFQAVYLQGVIDGWLSRTTGEPPWVVARRKGLNKCLTKQKIDGAMLADAVNSHYQAHKADWRVSPSVVLEETIQGICLADINSERAAVGLAPWERKPDQISKDAP
jgi:hypothetical protein